MTNLATVTLTGLLFWPIAGIVLAWKDIQPKTPSDWLATLLAGTVGGWFLAIFAGVAVWYVLRPVFALARRAR